MILNANAIGIRIHDACFWHILDVCPGIKFIIYCCLMFGTCFFRWARRWWTCASNPWWRPARMGPWGSPSAAPTTRQSARPSTYSFPSTLIEKKIQFSSYIRKFRWDRLQRLNNCAFPHTLGSPSSYMTSQPIPSEFSYIWGQFFSFFISVP